MWIEEPGAITERIELVGHKELCSYLLKGDVYALVGGSMAHVLPTVLNQLEGLRVDLERIRYLIILHTHYDHLGMAPYLVREWPWVKVVVSRVGAGVLTNQRALTAIQDYNNLFLDRAGALEQLRPLDLVGEGFPVHMTVEGGTELDLGDGLRLPFINVPGHSVCSIALFFPGEYALFPSDGIGTLTEERILPMGSSNYDDFQLSIEKLGKLGAEIICFEHYGALTPPEGKGFVERAKREARAFRSKMRDLYRTHGDVERVAEELSEDCKSGLSRRGLLPDDLLKDILRRMVKFVNGIE
jgi:glyoxylase-like metal-dependent hydrolase (beta-lactamase superfamily II)